MKTYNFKKITAVILSLAVFFSVCSAYSYAAGRKMTGIKIITPPVKTVFEENTDWIRGTWETDEDTKEISLFPSQKISFTHNAGYGAYPDRGMIDMTGLTVEVSYSDGTTSVMEYREMTNSLGNIYANILVSPKGGKEYFIGTNTLEVYLADDTKYYDSYDIEIVEGRPLIESQTAVIDYDRHCITGLNTYLSKAQLEEYLTFNAAEIKFTRIDSSSRFYGTGSTITVTSADGRQETYTIVIYGDVDGDSSISNEDISLVSLFLEDNSVLDSYEQKAADIDGMKRITIDDLAALMNVVSSGDELNQTDPSDSISS